MKELEEQKSFVYFYEGMSAEEDVVNQVGNQQQVSVTVESHLVNVKMHSGTESHLGVELQNEVNAHSNYKVCGYEKDADIPEKDVRSDSEAD